MRFRGPHSEFAFFSQLVCHILHEPTSPHSLFLQLQFFAPFAAFALFASKTLIYQDDLVTPGSLPCSACSRKQMRHSPKRRM